MIGLAFVFMVFLPAAIATVNKAAHEEDGEFDEHP